jgi:hypothetical protein
LFPSQRHADSSPRIVAANATTGKIRFSNIVLYRW